jgi:glycosyltransferase involved in cell wall biosynthesis
MSTLGVIIITKNEEKNIRRCLEAVKWADEIIVFDSGSTDNTVEICKEYTDKIWQTDWPGYGEQKQRALEKATCEWVLSVDADEVVTIGLRSSIERAILKQKHAGYYVRRDLIFYGQQVKHGAGTSKILRLVKRKLASFTLDKVHESLLVDGGTAVLGGKLLHYSVDTVANMIAMMNKYTDISAQQRYLSGRRGGVFVATLKALWMFSRVYFLNLGFLDGRAGLVLAVGFAEGAFYRYVKLYYLRKDASK